MGATDKIRGKSDKDGPRKVTEIGLILYPGAQVSADLGDGNGSSFNFRTRNEIGFRLPNFAAAGSRSQWHDRSLGSYLRSQFAGGSNREASQYWIVALSLSCAVLVVCRMSEW
jgi:hypothetical protein